MSKRVRKLLSWLFLTTGILIAIGAIGLHLLDENIRAKIIISHRDAIAFAAYECLTQNNIKTPQSEEQMAGLIYCKNPKGIDYLWIFKDLKSSRDKDIKDSFYDISYQVSFDGANIVVQSKDLKRPFVLGINKVQKN